MLDQTGPAEDQPKVRYRVTSTETDANSKQSKVYALFGGHEVTVMQEFLSNAAATYDVPVHSLRVIQISELDVTAEFYEN